MKGTPHLEQLVSVPGRVKVLPGVNLQQLRHNHCCGGVVEVSEVVVNGTELSLVDVMDGDGGGVVVVVVVVVDG